MRQILELQNCLLYNIKTVNYTLGRVAWIYKPKKIQTPVVNSLSNMIHEHNIFTSMERNTCLATKTPSLL